MLMDKNEIKNCEDVGLVGTPSLGHGVATPMGDVTVGQQITWS